MGFVVLAILLVSLVAFAASVHAEVRYETLGLNMENEKARLSVPGDSVDSLGADWLTCDMCKKLLPFVGTEDCASKCKDWWSFTAGVCTDVCDVLVKYLPRDVPCVAAGYCKA